MMDGEHQRAYAYTTDGGERLVHFLDDPDPTNLPLPSAHWEALTGTLRESSRLLD